MKKTTKGLLILSAVASLAASAGERPPKGKLSKAPVKVACEGLNECKGKGQCGGAGHTCAGNNSCRGKGWIRVTAEECKRKGGVVLADKD